MNTYLFGYLFIGVLTIFVLHFLNKDEGERLRIPSFRRKIFTVNWFLEDFLVHIIGYSLIIIAWPLGLGFKLKEKLFPPAPYVPKEEVVFRVKSEDLLSKQSIITIEKNEIIVDPLKAVPELPFGHLNDSWLAFKEKIVEGDEIWTFKAMFMPDYGDEYERNGYVLVKDGETTQTFFECD